MDPVLGSLFFGAASMGLSIFSGAKKDSNEKQRIEDQYEQDKVMWSHNEMARKDTEQFNKDSVDFARRNNQNMVDFQNKNIRRDVEKARADQENQYQAQRDAYDRSVEMSSKERRLNRGAFKQSEAETDTWLMEEEAKQTISQDEAAFNLGKAQNKASLDFSKSELIDEQELNAIKTRDNKSKDLEKSAKKSLKLEKDYISDKEDIAVDLAQNKQRSLNSDKKLAETKRTNTVKTARLAKEKANLGFKDTTEKARLAKKKADNDFERSKEDRTQSNRDAEIQKDSVVKDSALKIEKANADKTLTDAENTASYQLSRIAKDHTVGSSSLTRAKARIDSREDNKLLDYESTLNKEKNSENFKIQRASADEKIAQAKGNVALNKLDTDEAKADLDAQSGEIDTLEKIRNAELEETKDELTDKQEIGELEYREKRAAMAAKEEQAMIDNVIAEGSLDVSGRAGASAKRSAANTLAKVGRQQKYLSNTLLNTKEIQETRRKAYTRKTGVLTTTGADKGTIAAAKKARMADKKTYLDKKKGSKDTMLRASKIAAEQTKTAQENIKDAIETNITDSRTAKRNKIYAEKNYKVGQADINDARAKGEFDEKGILKGVKDRHTYKAAEYSKEVAKNARQTAKDSYKNSLKKSTTKFKRAKAEKSYTKGLQNQTIETQKNLRTKNNESFKNQKEIAKNNKAYEMSDIGKRQDQIRSDLKSTLADTGFQQDKAQQNYDDIKQSDKRNLQQSRRETAILKKKSGIRDEEFNVANTEAEGIQAMSDRKAAAQYNSAKTRAAFSKQSAKRQLKIANINTKEKEMLEPIQPAAIPKPNFVPVTQFQDIKTGRPAPKPKKGTASGMGLLTGIGQALNVGASVVGAMI